MSNSIYNGTSQSFGALTACFVMEALGEVIPWLYAMAAIIVADLVCGLMRSLKQKEEIRFSRAVRETMQKFCTYFAVVVCFSFYDVASGNKCYAEGACFCVMIIESLSIASNVLKYNGYNLNFNKLASVLISKRFDIADSDGIITKQEDKNGTEADKIRSEE